MSAREAGDDRWAATLLDHLVFAEPGHEAAQALLAETYDQLGYRAESGPWRDVYLTAAHELRNGIQGTAIDPSSPFAGRGEGKLRRHAVSPGCGV